jgi:hypothetical protein
MPARPDAASAPLTTLSPRFSVAGPFLSLIEHCLCLI